MSDEDNVQLEYEEDDYEEEEDFLAGLGSDRFTPPPPAATEREAARAKKDVIRDAKAAAAEAVRDAKRAIREQKAAEKERILENKRAAKRRDKGEPEPDDNELFSDSASPILGRDKIILIKKVKQYKSLFPEELKKFKIKKNPGVKDLEDALVEMETFVEVNGIDGFLMDGVIQSIKLIEGASSYTKYDIRGCADLLKSNKQFHSLCKQLFVKYQVFSAVPAEYQLLMLVSTTAFVCVNKNKPGNRDSINAYLNEPVK
jgi:hypothetical protein